MLILASTLAIALALAFAHAFALAFALHSTKPRVQTHTHALPHAAAHALSYAIEVYATISHISPLVCASAMILRGTGTESVGRIGQKHLLKIVETVQGKRPLGVSLQMQARTCMCVCVGACV